MSIIPLIFIFLFFLKIRRIVQRRRIPAATFHARHNHVPKDRKPHHYWMVWDHVDRVNRQKRHFYCSKRAIFINVDDMSKTIPNRILIQFIRLDDRADTQEKLGNFCMRPVRLLWGKKYLAYENGRFEKVSQISKIQKLFLAIVSVVLFPLIAPLSLAGWSFTALSKTHAEMYKIYCVAKQKPKSPRVQITPIELPKKDEPIRRPLTLQPILPLRNPVPARNQIAENKNLLQELKSISATFPSDLGSKNAIRQQIERIFREAATPEQSSTLLNEMIRNYDLMHFIPEALKIINRDPAKLALCVENLSNAQLKRIAKDILFYGKDDDSVYQPFRDEVDRQYRITYIF